MVESGYYMEKGVRVVKKNVYYCDFCKKRGLRSLKTHEAHCTLNPDRTCRLCKEKVDYRALVDKLPFTTEEREWPGNHYSVKSADLMDLAGNCPICALTVLRLFMRKRSDDAWGFQTDFNFKAELESWWKDANEAAERDLYDD